MATNRQANLAQFYFFCGSLPTDTFEVQSFSGTDSISMPYQFSLLLLAQSDSLAPADVVNKPGSLYIYRAEEFFPYSGIVTEFRYAGKHSGKAAYVVKLVPKLWQLGLSRQTRIFQKMKVTQVVKQVLDKAGLSDYYTFKVDESKLPELEYVVQYQESDLNFVSRLLEANGIWYFFKEAPVLNEELGDGNSKESLLITDDIASFSFVDSSSDLIFRAAAGMTEQVQEDDRESISNVQLNQQVIPKDVLLKDYNDRTPEVTLTGQKAVKGGDVGSVYSFGSYFSNTSEAQRRVQIEAERFSCQKIVLEGAGNCRGFRAGKRYTLQEHHRDDLNAKYVITRVSHQGAHSSAPAQGSTPTYTNQFTCLPASQAEQYRPPLRAIVPRVNGIITARIEANGSDYAALDDSGRYKVRMSFDNSDAKNYEASRYVRLAQPYSGANYGLHFPSHEGTEMVLACIDGDPDRPVGLATVPNANTLPPVVSQNKSQNVIRTAGGNEVLLDDEDSKQKVRITTKAAHTLEMADKEDERKILLKSAGKHSLLLDDKNELAVWSADKNSITMKHKSGEETITITTAGGHVITVDDKNKKISIKTKAGNAMEMDDDGKKITLADSAGKNKVTLDGNGGLILNSQGKIEITASQDLVIKAANIKMEASAGVDVKATSDLKLKGMNTEIKADMNAKMNGGMNIELKGGMQAKLDGMMTDVNGSAMTKVKGGVVMIN